MTITAAADGSALGNPGPAGWAWYIDDNQWASGGWAHGTNNMGELMAVLDLFRATEHRKDEELHILCDSQYVINSVTKWMPGWKKKGWKKSDGKPVLNLELLKEIDEAIKGRNYRFEWVKGHAGHDLNEAADERARAAATAYQAGREPDAGPGLSDAPAAQERTAKRAHLPSLAMDNEGPVTLEATKEQTPGVVPQQAPLEAPVAPLPAQREPEASASDLHMVYELESELLSDEVRGDMREVLAFLHPEFQEISRDGSLTDRSTIIAALSAGQPLPPGGSLQVLAANPLGQNMVQLAYRLQSGSHVILCSSFWHRIEGRWLLRYRQETPSS